MPESTSEIVEAVEVPTREMAPATGVFGADPVKAFQEMERMVKHVSAKLTGPKYIADIQGKKYPKCEWWVTNGNALGLMPIVEWSRQMERVDETAWEASARIETPAGRIVGRAEAMCSSKENQWRNSDEYAIRSMSQTRAIAKAYRTCLSSLAVMAELAPTCAEEVPSGGFQDKLEQRQSPFQTDPADERPITDAQKGRLFAIARDAGWPTDNTYHELKDFLKVNFKIESSKDIKRNNYDEIIEYIQKGPAAYGGAKLDTSETQESIELRNK